MRLTLAIAIIILLIVSSRINCQNDEDGEEYEGEEDGEKDDDESEKATTTKSVETTVKSMKNIETTTIKPIKRITTQKMQTSTEKITETIIEKAKETTTKKPDERKEKEDKDDDNEGEDEDDDSGDDEDDESEKNDKKENDKKVATEKSENDKNVNKINNGKEKEKDNESDNEDDEREKEDEDEDEEDGDNAGNDSDEESSTNPSLIERIAKFFDPETSKVDMNLTPREKMIESFKKLNTLSQMIIRDVLPVAYDMMYTLDVQPQCLSGLTKVLQALQNEKEWAMKLVDSMGHFPSGTLSGTLTSFGDFDQCLSVIEPDIEPVLGKYCLLKMRPNLPVKPPRITYKDILIDINGTQLNENMIVKNILIPQLYSFYYYDFINGICIPSTCTEQDIKQLANRCKLLT